MTSTALLSGALLSAATLGAAHLVISPRQHRDRCALTTTQLHHALLSRQEEHPETAGTWPTLTHLSEDARTRVGSAGHRGPAVPRNLR
ncbi:hypothetical protein [Streptomyces sp. NRRL F-5135]|uniref:hypothetical protein n=1 Tax=Streptomyces sp. NRRL F-5135 TaxID=1463858 RepID=UPI00131C4233|nr:hypothetical protein [Streptomyces sp. NRRL F-5135]